MNEDITLAVAQQSVNTWADQVMQDHYAAEDCFHCEKFLSAGINAQLVVASVDAIYREGDKLGLRRYTSDLRADVSQMFKTWLLKSHAADAWIDRLRAAGYAPENREAYEAAKQAAAAWMEEFAWTNTSQQSLARIIADDL